MLNCDIVSLTSSAHHAQGSWSKAQQQILETLQLEENRQISLRELSRKAHVSKHAWYKAIQDEQFVATVEALGVRIKRKKDPEVTHLQVNLAFNPEEELRKDIWDMRRLKTDYPKHNHPCDFIVDFSWIRNALLREQVKKYFRHRLPKWKAKTFKCVLYHLKKVLMHLPENVHVGVLDRKQIQELLPKVIQLGDYAACRCLWVLKAMLEYMATSPSWSGPRPSRFLVWDEDIPSEPHTLPRPIPPDILDQLDPLLEKAVEAMKQGRDPFILSPMIWDTLLILRHTGMRAEDVAHLKAPDASGRNGCLDQDAEGYWWLRIDYKITKMGKDHRIPTRMSDGVIEAVHRQQKRIRDISNHFGEHYLFRHERGVVTYGALKQALEKLAQYLTYEDQPYRIAPHQFRHSLATDMIEQGVDIYTVKEFLGHKSLAMTERYVKVYLKSLKAKYDTYRLKKEQTSASATMSQVQITQIDGEADGGWVEGKVGKLYLSPLPDGIGKCAHLPMHDPCPDIPHCPTCPKLRATKHHLPMWENKIKNLHLTVEALRENPLYDRARQKHEQELRHAEKVVETIKREGSWDGRIHNSKTNTH